MKMHLLLCVFAFSVAVAGFAHAANIATIETQASGTAVTLDTSPVVTAILSQPGTWNGKTYTGWSFLAQDSSGSLDIFATATAQRLGLHANGRQYHHQSFGQIFALSSDPRDWNADRVDLGRYRRALCPLPFSPRFLQLTWRPSPSPPPGTCSNWTT